MTTPAHRESAPDLSAVPTDNGELANQIERWAEFRSRWDAPPTRRWIEDLAEYLGSMIIGPLAVALEQATTLDRANAATIKRPVVDAVDQALRSMAEDLSEAEGLGRALPDRPLDTVWAWLLGEVRSSRAEVERLRGDLVVSQASDRSPGSC